MSKKVALVTGSGKRRVGAYVADALAEKGYSLVIHYRSSAKEAEEAVARYKKAGTSAIAVQADLAEEASVKMMVSLAMKEFGRIDVLVNAAAVWESKELEEVTAADVKQNFDINTLGTFLCCQQVGLAMVKQPEGGCIITIGDWATHRPYTGYAAYFPSKGAIPTLTRTLAVELAHRNPAIRVNCILPGPVMLPPDLPEQVKADAINATLVKREGSPKNIAHAAMFLIENDFVTGVCLPVDGGRTVYSPDSDA